MKRRIIGIVFIILGVLHIIMPQVKANEISNNNTVIANIVDDSKTVEKNKSVFIEMHIDNIENVKSIIGNIANTKEPEQYITVELNNTTQGKWYYFDVPSNLVIGETYIMPVIQVVYNDETIINGKSIGEFKVIGKEIEDNNTVIANIADDSKTVEKNKSVFVEMNIDNIENVKSIIGNIANTKEPEQYITVELNNTTQGKWYYFDVPSNLVIGEIYIMPVIKVIYNDGTIINGKVEGQIKIIENIKEISTSNKTDNTMAKGTLPKTGKNTIIGLASILLIFSIVIKQFIKKELAK